MANIWIELIGVAVGLIIAGTTYYYHRQAQNQSAYRSQYNEDEIRQNKGIKKCFGCHEEISVPSHQFLCGHVVHDSCLYKMLIKCSVGQLMMFRCDECKQPINNLPLLKEILSSRCCVCAEKCDLRTISLPSCGHRLHHKCLEADVIRQQLGQNKTMYECPYTLLECENRVEFLDLPV